MNSSISSRRTPGIHWVRDELEQAMTRARVMLERAADSGDRVDAEVLYRAQQEFAQLRGTATMIECHGLALAAAEVIAALEDLQARRIDETEPLYAALMGASIQLVDYLHAIAEDTADCILVLQPAINELRLARGQPVLSESELFTRQMTALGLTLAIPATTVSIAGAMQMQARRLLPMFQSALLAWMRNTAEAQTGAARAGKIAEQLGQLTRDPLLHPLCRAATAAIEAYLAQGLSMADGMELKRLFGRLNSVFKTLADEGESAAQQRVESLALQLLFLVGRASQTGARAQALIEAYELQTYLPAAAVIEQQRRRIHGANTALLAKVAGEIRSEFAQVKDQIDLGMRTGTALPAAAVGDNLQKIAATLAALGLTRQQQLVLQQIRPIQAPQADGADWMALATAILRIENDLDAALFRQVQAPDAQAQVADDQIPTAHDLAQSRSALYREFLTNLARIESTIDACIKTGDDSGLAGASTHLGEIISGFEMLARADVAALCRRLLPFIQPPRAQRLRSQPLHAERLADAIALIEHYIDSLRVGLPAADHLLRDLDAAIGRLQADDAADHASKGVADDAETAAAPNETLLAPAPAVDLPAVAEEDEEIRAIFIEEANEVQADQRSAFANWSRDVQDREALATLRRGFHTLKGSGRTVGASEIGELGWALENMLNKCLDGSVAVNPGIISSVDRALKLLPALTTAFAEKRALDDDRDTTEALAALIADAAAYAAGKIPASDERNELRSVFAEDAAEKLALVQDWLERTPPPTGVDSDALRAFHTLRGSARVIDAHAISTVAGATEDYLEALTEAGLPPDAEVLTLIGQITHTLLDWSAQAADTAASEDNPADPQPWLVQLQSLRAALPEISQASSIRRQLIEVFAGEAFDLVSSIEEQLRGWSQALDSRHAAADLRALSHTLKGAAQMAHCTGIAEVAHALERSFAGAQARAIEPRKMILSMLLQACEGLFQYLDRYREGRLDGDEDGWRARILALDWALDSPSEDSTSEPVAQTADTPAAQSGQAPGSQVQQAAETPSEPLADEPMDLTAPVSLDPPPLAPAAPEPGELAETGGALAEADASGFDPELADIFAEEARELVDGLDQSLMQLEHHPADAQALSETRRLLHTLKGSARVAGFADLGELAHLIEQLFAQFDERSPAARQRMIGRSQQVMDGLNHVLGDITAARAEQIEEWRDVLALPLEDAATPAPPAANGDDTPPAETDAVTAPEPASPPIAAAHATPVLPADFDLELAQTFAAEAEELMDALEAALRQWQAHPADFAPAREMLRHLHTYKGGARMAQLNRLGDAAHELESVIEGIEYAGEPDATALQVVQGAVTELRRFTDQLQRQDYEALLHSGEADEAAPAPIDRFDPPMAAASAFDEAAESPAHLDDGGSDQHAPDATADTVPDAAPPSGMWDPQLFWRPDDDEDALAAQRRETARVPVDALDKMLNEAGEISIYRSRMDEHNAAIQSQLDDMAQAISRVRDQLRQLGIETDAQISARGLAASAQSDRYAGEFDPLEMDRYTRMQELSRALNESVGDLAAVHASLDELASEGNTILLQQERINTQVQEGLMRTLMVPFSRQSARLQRVVQQTAAEHGKRVQLLFEGAEAELDRTVLERMTAPLEHLLRNAVIHGIESPEARAQAGKTATGVLTLKLWREGSQLHVELADDGGGLDLAAIRATAIKRGLMPEQAQVSDDQIAQFIFQPGFSTAQKLTQDAGRGVGMDVVAAEVKQLGGTLELASEAGKGARFRVRLPLTLAMQQSLLLGIGSELYAAPLPSIEGITRIARDQLDACLTEPGTPLEYGGQAYRVLHLADLIGSAREIAEGRTVHAVLVRLPEGLGGGERRVAIVVDQLLGRRQVVSKPVGPQVSAVAGITGATLLADGRVVLILDLAALVQDHLRRALRQQSDRVAAPAAAEAVHVDTIMVVDDSITIRRVTERLLQRQGYAVMTAKDGLDAMAQLATERPAAILLDIEMPRADGFEVATFVRNTEAIAATPIIMITSRSGDKHRERATAIGVQRYLIKPYQEDQLLSELRTVIEASRR